MDRGAWWAAVHGVTQSSTRLKWLSMHAYIREGNGNPLQYSCLENPRNGVAWWAAIYGVTQSWIRLRRLSGSSYSSAQFSCSVLLIFAISWTGACSNSSPSSQWCYPTISSSVILFSACLQFSQHRVFSSESVLCIGWPKYWSFRFSISPSNEYSELIYFRVDLF